MRLFSSQLIPTVFTPRPGRRLNPARTRLVAGLLAVAASLAHAEPQHYPRVLMPGRAPYTVITRHGPRVFAAEARADRIMVRLQPANGFHRLTVEAVKAALGLKVHRLWADMALCVLEVDSAKVHSEIARLGTLPMVKDADYDALVHCEYVPNTPDYQKQWHHPIIATPRAWDVLAPGAWPTVVIGDVDTGLDITHPDIVGHVWVNANAASDTDYPNDIHGWNFVDSNNDVQAHPTGIDQDGDGTPDEQVNHGTFVCGLAAASVFDDYGVAGVYPNALLMQAKIFPADNTTTTDMVIEGMNYCIDRGCDILNLSIGAPYSADYTPAIIKAHSKGIVVCAAAGNGNGSGGLALTDSYWTSPVCNDGTDPLSSDNFVIGVAATDPSDRKASYSNYDSSTRRHFVDVCAPGGDNGANNMYSTAVYAPAFPAFSTYYTYMSGTSFSSPLVAGLAAMVKAVYPSLTNDQIRDRIIATTDNVDRLNGIYAGKIGSGRINCARALGISSAPRPPTSVMAYDTLHDQGGSITITWTLSGDDGAGSNSVTGYTIQRGLTSTGPFTTVGSASAGTAVYLDNTTTDGTPYYYQVGATDGTLTTYSTVAGPATSADDTPPPPVTTLTAVDRPGDSGGAIDLDWYGYTPPSDFKEYRVYRDLYSFNAVGSRTPILPVITDPTLTHVSDTTTIDYTDYYYAVVAVDHAGNFYPVLTCAGPVHSMPNSTITLNQGMYFMSAPVVPTDGNPTTFFGSPTPAWKYARYDLANSDYAICTPGGAVTDVTRMDLGRGFWVYFPQSLEVQLNGNAAGSGNFAVDLPIGWQSIGNPYYATMDMRLAEIQVGTQYMDIASAEAGGYVSSSLYTYDRSTFSYRLKSALWTGDATVEPWDGFWFQVLQPCRLIMIRPTTTAAAGVTSASAGSVKTASAPTVIHGPAPPSLLWKFRLSLQGRTGGDYDNFVAVSSATVHSAPKPPAAPSAPRLYIDDNGVACAAVARQPARTISWKLTVVPAAGDDSTWLSAEDLGSVPAEYAIMLIDSSAGRTVNLRQQPRVEIVGAGPRQLTLQAVRQGGATLVVTSMGVQQTGAGAQVVVTLSAPASCDVEVVNIAGRSVRVVRRGLVMSAGQNTVVWDGRSASGATVPNGMYLVRLSARDDSGIQVQSVRTIVLRR